MSSAGNYFIRTASRRDLPAVRALLVETWHDTCDSIYGAARVGEITDSWHSPEALEARLGQPNSEFVIADNGSEIAGMAYAVSGEGGGALHLQQLYVLPARQRLGIGRALLAEIEDSFPEAREIRLEVEEANASAIAFYVANGFSRLGRADAADQTAGSLPALIYGKTL
ncbi:hypothetical protein NA8A_08594 [Nitratireductor indicus C115]|uniref:N-acetyltransferase domain-containing protein n=1 Tax=Nitratireductor indicus C115 TaxID=1231190 RepID=K2PNS7_9HYPH|nr:N-acetyltransferase [Nitratireductor indicus]EKF42712.1 hypothetical protein NA8A_08594 [Nitratireductor indicus C115]SFQ39190.1 Ribosomal protein S18 acetylase RimI [Nitratireductor indicus]